MHVACHYYYNTNYAYSKSLYITFLPVPVWAVGSLFLGEKNANGKGCVERAGCVPCFKSFKAIETSGRAHHKRNLLLGSPTANHCTFEVHKLAMLSLLKDDGVFYVKGALFVSICFHPLRQQGTWKICWFLPSHSSKEM